MLRWLALAVLVAAGVVGWTFAKEQGADAPRSPAVADAKGIEFYEKKIRPVLVEQCYSCHSAEAHKNKKLKASLFVDSREGLLKGGDSGPSVVPGKAKDSLLLKALHYSPDLRMPPRRKLPDEVIADFTTWVNMGAPQPESKGGVAKVRTINLEEERKFWSYQPVKQQAAPVVKNTDWPVNDIDRFVLARLEAKGLAPVADAEPAVLARRLYYDLTGLPPTPEEIDEFVKDYTAKPQAAVERLADRLLASPRFGERWGRHWLDVARYAESLTLRGFILKEAWRYRDYVIDAFNSDMPFDRFMQEQVAGDLLPAANQAERRRQLIATTFLTLGNTNLEEQDKKQLRMDVVDEQLDTVGRAFLAQTIGCARCHDHKFDPIPTKDYYALAGIFRNAKTLEHSNVSKWLEMPLPVDPAEEAKLQKHEAAVAALQGKIKELRGQIAAKGKPVGKRTGAIAIKDLPGIVVDDADAMKVGDWKVSQTAATYIGAGYAHDQDGGKGSKTITFQPMLPAAGKYEVRLAYSAGTNRAKDVPVTIFSADGEKTVHINQQETPPIEGLFVSLGQYNFEKNDQGHVLIANEDTKGHVIVDAMLFIPVDKLDAAPKAETPDSKKPMAELTADLKKLEDELKKLQDTGPKRDLVMTVVEEKVVGDTQVHIRGSVHNLGEKAPRGFLQAATYGTTATMPAKESGRRQLGDWLADKTNPLPARVTANRAWHWLFGSGLVRTTDNFGTTGELPSHPELVDYLAGRLVARDWSMKKLIREIVLSRTYRLSSVASSQLATADPENRLFGHANRRRMEAELIRDTMLSLGGKLQLDMGGPSYRPNIAADYNYQHADLRRSVYSPVFRNALPEIFEVFDFADPSVSTGRRNVSTVAPQALFLLNHPFVIEHARGMAKRLASENLDESARIERAYRQALGRVPTDAERRIAVKFLSQPGNAGDNFALFCQALFASADFRYVN